MKKNLGIVIDRFSKYEAVCDFYDFTVGFSQTFSTQQLPRN